MKVTCPYCSQPAVLTSSKEVYRGQDYGKIYLCRPCNAYVGVHEGTDRPLGRLANAELRKLKMAAHAAFDPIWKSKQTRRSDAYRWLASKLGITMAECHIGMFDEDQCKKVVEFCKANQQADEGPVRKDDGFIHPHKRI